MGSILGQLKFLSRNLPSFVLPEADKVQIIQVNSVSKNNMERLDHYDTDLGQKKNKSLNMELSAIVNNLIPIISQAYFWFNTYQSRYDQWQKYDSTQKKQNFEV